MDAVRVHIICTFYSSPRCVCFTRLLCRVSSCVIADTLMSSTSRMRRTGAMQTAENRKYRSVHGGDKRYLSVHSGENIVNGCWLRGGHFISCRLSAVCKDEDSPLRGKLRKKAMIERNLWNVRILHRCCAIEVTVVPVIIMETRFPMVFELSVVPAKVAQRWRPGLA